jgi:hypothetical protein
LRRTTRDETYDDDVDTDDGWNKECCLFVCMIVASTFRSNGFGEEVITKANTDCLIETAITNSNTSIDDFIDEM